MNSESFNSARLNIVKYQTSVSKKQMDFSRPTISGLSTSAADTAEVKTFSPFRQDLNKSQNRTYGGVSSIAEITQDKLKV